MLILFIMWGTLGMAVIQAMFSAGDLGYRAVYVYGVMIVGVAYVLPPRLILPAFALNHALYVTLILTGDFDARFRLASLADGTLGVMFASGVSWLLHRAKWNDFLKERTIAAQNHELARRNNEMKDLMAVAAHDLRSPLQGLDNVLAQAVDLVDPSTGRLKRALTEGRESCRRMLSLVTRLLDAHAAEHRRASNAVSHCDACAVFAAAAARVEKQLAAHGAALKVELPTAPAEVAMDEASLGQVLDNLLGNALKFAPVGSDIELALFATERGWVGEVRDAGPGVPADEQADLFQKFRRGSNRSTGGESGFGLGLFIVRQLLRSAGGDVSYADRSPHGAIFRVMLPQAS